MVAIKRPFGIAVIAVLLTVVGGAMTLITFIEAFDSIRSLGFDGISIITPASFFGFLIYGATPIFFYITGMGLFLSRRWAYILMIKIFPFLCFLMLFILTINIVRQRFFYYEFNVVRIFFLKPQFFFWMIFWYILIIWPLRVYLKSPYIESFFISDENI